VSDDFTSVGSSMNEQVALMFRLVSAFVALKHLRCRPVFTCHVPLQVNTTFEHLATLGTCLWSAAAASIAAVTLAVAPATTRRNAGQCRRRRVQGGRRLVTLECGRHRRGRLDWTGYRCLHWFHNSRRRMKLGRRKSFWIDDPFWIGHADVLVFGLTMCSPQRRPLFCAGHCVQRQRDTVIGQLNAFGLCHRIIVIDGSAVLVNHDQRRSFLLSTFFGSFRTSVQ